MLRRLPLLEPLKDELVHVVDTVARIGLNLKLHRRDAPSHLQANLLDQVVVKLEEHQLEMVIKKVVQDCENLRIYPLIGHQLLVVTRSDHLDYQLRKHREDVVVVVFADGKVDVVTRDHVIVQPADHFHQLPLFFVLVPFPLDLLLLQTVPNLE